MNELRERIVNYVPYDEQEESDKKYILKFIDTFDDVLTRKNIFGHFCSSAFVVNKNRSKVLMIYHNIYNSWAWPGGHADGESDLLGVAMREVMEETGIKNLKPLSKDFYAIDVLPVKSHIKRGKFVSSHIHLNATYIFEADENEELLSRISNCASDSIRKNIKATKNNYNDLKTLLIQDVSHYVVSETGRKPLILPVFLEIKK